MLLLGWLCCEVTNTRGTRCSGVPSVMTDQMTEDEEHEGAIFKAVIAMKDAVSIAIKHGDIRRDVVRAAARNSFTRCPEERIVRPCALSFSPQVCTGVGMSTSELNFWLQSKYVCHERNTFCPSISARSHVLPGFHCAGPHRLGTRRSPSG